ncbi:MAG: tRNA (adenosine(37)-N6)-threonylcarbamoyltransferase complex transferase subunit TsaD [Bacteroidia bacterium]|nr:tRNA (adenosine(37)-N6)-threonylcarbamoyltransferase complex transferase subunit TsaD [Bacteroidia bacterium]
MEDYILAIESSCDDTSAAVICDGEVLSNIVSTQTAHAMYGGVVPELASREHQQHILPVVNAALKQAEISKTQLKAIAFTRGPGLLGSLIVGVTFAKAMAYALNIPIVEVHHMRAHVLSNFARKPYPAFPFLCLTVSGGHTQIVKANSYLEFEILGQTLDDAAGEAFDKTGKMLGLPYPAGPIIDKHAKNGTVKYSFPKAKVEGLNFSFSGLKTAIMYFLRAQTDKNPDFISQEIENICASVQFSIIDMLMDKLEVAAEQTGINEIAIAGGVSANSGLRSAVAEFASRKGWNYYIPDFEFCRDNAAMIGITGYYKYKAGLFASQEITAAARIPL